jgi:hypothetical protein
MDTQKNNHPQEYIFQVYLDEELSPSHRRNFEKHINWCEKCREVMLELQDLYSQIEGLSEFEPPSDLSTVILDRLIYGKKGEPLLKRMTMIQISFTSVLVIISLSITSLDLINSILSDLLTLILSGLQKSIWSIIDGISSFYNLITNIKIPFSNIDVFSVFNAPSLNHLLLFAISSGLLWLLGNRVLLSRINHTYKINGG